MEQKEVVINKRALNIGLTIVAMAALIEWALGIDGIFSESILVVAASVILAQAYVVGVFLDRLLGNKKKGNK